jgi:hypothetical protein
MSDRKKPKQITVKYLGNISKLAIDDIPEEYRKTENVISFFGKFSDKGRDKESDRVFQDRLFEALINYDINEVLNIYSSSTKNIDLTDFYEFILIPVLAKGREPVGERRIRCCHGTLLAVMQHRT